MDTQLKLLDWAKRIQALAQSGLAYGKDQYDMERYQELREISVDMIALMSLQDRVELEKGFASEQGYATPKVGARGVIFEQGKVLMVREESDGKWCLPGGWSDIGETPSGTVIKEVKEETGYDVQVKRLLTLFDRKCHKQPPSIYDIYTLFFECEIIGGSPQPNMEIEEIGFFALDDLPQLSLERINREQMDIIFKYMDDPWLAPYFD